MATNVNKFLAPTLQNPAIKGRGSATFIDNRALTATPTPYIETITPGKNGVQGFIGSTDSKGNIIPEPNAFIYIYINGFLINPPVLNPDGSFNNTKTAIVSDIRGKWTTGNSFFDALPAFQYNQTITFKAKAPLKQVSARSVPYAIGGTPTPIELGIFGDNGILRPPYEGESSLMGRISYWFGNLQPVTSLNSAIPNIAGTAGIPLLNSSNHVYVYIDGTHVGTSGGVLGEVFANEVRGINAPFPVSENLKNYSLSLIVDNSQIDIPLSGIQPIDTSNLVGVQDGTNNTFLFFLPDDNLGIKLFKNGVRLLEKFDYRYIIDGGTKIGTATFLKGTPDPGDKLTVLFQYEAKNYILEELLSGVVDGVNNVFTLGTLPRLTTIEIYENGIHLIQGTDYSVSGQTITFTQIPAVNTLLMADYQPSTSSNQFVNIQIPVPISGDFLFATPNMLGNPHVFVNGLLQQEGLFNDYTIKNGNLIVFTPWAAPVDGDTLLVAFYSTPVLLSLVVNYLNQSQQFKDYSLTASTLSTKPIINYFNVQGLKNGVNTYFARPLTDHPVKLRLFKNGARLKELYQGSGDYFLDYEKSLIVFSVPPSPSDDLVGLLNYIISNFIVGEVPTGAINGTNVTFSLTMLPNPKTVQIFYNGIRLNPLSNHPDYSLFQNVITFNTFVPSTDDIILVDYEVAFGFTTYTSIVVPEGQATGNNPDFTFATPSKGTAINVYKNGLLQQPDVDYVLNRQSIHFYNNMVPQHGDTILLEFNDASLFTNSSSDQLRISSPFTLDIKRYNDPKLPLGYSGKLLFGSDVELYPGKDDDGEFRFWFNSRTGYWKWTQYDPTTGVTTPFTRGQRITARVKNDMPFIYTTKR